MSIEAYLAELGHAAASQSGGTLSYHCPLPGHADHHPSFTVKAGRWTCWSHCATGGDVIDLVIALDGCSKAEAIDKLAAMAGLARWEPISARRFLPKDNAKALFDRFVDERQWLPEAVEKMGLRAVIDDFGRPRARFSYFYGDTEVWHQDRALGTGPKWFSPKGKPTAVYNANALELPWERDRELLVCEGPSDVMALLSTFTAPAVVGIPGAGNFRPKWVGAFAGLRQVVVIGDNDPAGDKFRARCRSLLEPVVDRVLDLRVPEPWNDLDEWRRGTGTSEPEIFADAFCKAAEDAEVGSDVAA